MDITQSFTTVHPTQWTLSSNHTLSPSLSEALDGRDLGQRSNNNTNNKNGAAAAAVFTTCQVNWGSPSNVVITVAFMLIFILAVCGNSLVIVTIVQQKWMRTVTNLYLLNLAISDLFLVIICMPQSLLAFLLKCFVFGEFMCRIISFVQPLSVTASAYTLAVIAIERYYAICKPLRSRRWQCKSHAVKMILLTWLLAVSTNFFHLIVYKLEEIRPGQMNCQASHSYLVNLLLFLFILVFLYLLPLCIMLVLYGMVIKNLWTGIQLETQHSQRSNDALLDETTKTIAMDSPTIPLQLRKVPLIARISSSLGARNARDETDGSPATKWSNFRPKRKWNNFRRRRSSSKENDKKERPPVTPPTNSATMSSILAPEHQSSNSSQIMETLQVPSTKSNPFSSSSARPALIPPSERNGTANNTGHSGHNIGNQTVALRSTHSERSLLAKKRVIKMLLTVVILFALSWTPLYLMNLFLNICWTFGVYRFNPVIFGYVYHWLQLASFLSTCSNPIAYCFMNQKFRTAFMLAFGCNSCLADDGNSRTPTTIHNTNTIAASSNNGKFQNHHYLSTTNLAVSAANNKDHRGFLRSKGAAGLADPKYCNNQPQRLFSSVACNLNNLHHDISYQPRRSDASTYYESAANATVKAAAKQQFKNRRNLPSAAYSRLQSRPRQGKTAEVHHIAGASRRGIVDSAEEPSYCYSCADPSSFSSNSASCINHQDPENLLKPQPSSVMLLLSVKSASMDNVYGDDYDKNSAHQQMPTTLIQKKKKKDDRVERIIERKPAKIPPLATAAATRGGEDPVVEKRGSIVSSKSKSGQNANNSDECAL